MKNLIFAAALIGAVATSASAEVEKFAFDAGHSQIVFNFNHLGFSTTTGMFAGFDGEILFDDENPANSSVTASFPVISMFTGWEKRDKHFMSADFFDASEDEMVTFTSTSIEVTGDDTALITGDLTLNGITKSVVLDTTMTNMGIHPRANKPWMGLDATTTLLRTDYGVGAAAPFVGDEVQVHLSIEAGIVE